MSELTVVPITKVEAVHADDGPQPAVLFENERAKVIVGGLQAGQSIPEHPEALAVYHILEGKGRMLVDGRPIEVAPGATVVTPAGSRRGLTADTQLSFLATRIAP